MDALGDFQRMAGPATLRFVAENADLIKFLVIAGCLVGGWLVVDGLKSPRQMFDKLFHRGSSDGRGDIPREE
jgi:hypothetical protein